MRPYPLQNLTLTFVYLYAPILSISVAAIALKTSIIYVYEWIVSLLFFIKTFFILIDINKRHL